MKSFRVSEVLFSTRNFLTGKVPPIPAGASVPWSGIEVLVAVTVGVTVLVAGG